MAKAQGFSREERICRTTDFDRVFAEGRRARGPLLAVNWLPNGRPHSRLGVALRQGWKGAVARNRAKRLVREAFRTHKRALPKGLDIIVVPATNWHDPRPQEIAEEMMRLLGAAGEDA